MKILQAFDGKKLDKILLLISVTAATNLKQSLHMQWDFSARFS